MVVANFLLSPEAQLRKQDPAVWGDPTVLAMDKLDPADRQLLRDATQQTLETMRSGQVVGWRGGRNSGTVVAQRAFFSAELRWCRSFEQQVIIGGTTRRNAGVACRRPDGVWEIAPQQ